VTVPAGLAGPLVMVGATAVATVVPDGMLAVPAGDAVPPGLCVPDGDPDAEGTGAAPEGVGVSPAEGGAGVGDADGELPVSLTWLPTGWVGCPLGDGWAAGPAVDDATAVVPPSVGMGVAPETLPLGAGDGVAGAPGVDAVEPADPDGAVNPTAPKRGESFPRGASDCSPSVSTGTAASLTTRTAPSLPMAGTLARASLTPATAAAAPAPGEGAGSRVLRDADRPCWFPVGDPASRRTAVSAPCAVAPPGPASPA
jgi:hypothetical protein